MTENATLRKLQNEYIWKQRFSVYKRETKCFVWQSDCVSLQTYNPVPKKWGRCVTHNDFKHNNRRLEMHDEFHSQIRPELIRSGGRTKKNQKSGPTTQWAVNQNCLKLSSENLTTKPPFSKEIKHKLRNKKLKKLSSFVCLSFSAQPLNMRQGRPLTSWSGSPERGGEKTVGRKSRKRTSVTNNNRQ